jgi:hypothetical protein
MGSEEIEMIVQRWKKALVCGIIVLFLSTNIAPTTSQHPTPCTSFTSENIDHSPIKSGILTNHGSLSGLVTDEEMNPLQGVRVRVSFHETYREDDTDATGYYRVTDVPVCADVKNVSCTKLGYYTTYAALSINESTTRDFVLTPMPIYPVLNGTIGENGWYTNGVAISFHVNGTVNHTYYALDEDPWTEYTAPITIKQDGMHVLHWHDTGNSSNVYWVGFKIDRTAPVIINFTVSALNLRRTCWLMNAAVVDATSGVAKMEFYVDDTLVGTVNRAPFEYLYQGRGRVCQAIAYDRAGNSAMTNPPLLVERSQGFQQYANPPSIGASGDHIEGSETTMYHGVLSGHVTDVGMHPLQGACVRVSFHDTYRENYTDAAGYYKVNDIPVCVCNKNVSCAKLGYYTMYTLVDIHENTTHDFIINSMPVYPILSGTMGESGWYVSPVVVTPVMNSSCDFLYAIDEGPWTEFIGPFMVAEDGIHVLHWFWVNHQGNSSGVYWVGFKIDCTAPTVTFFTAQRLALKVWKFSTNASDNTSGINRVEIWCDHQILGSYPGPPYEAAWVGWSFIVCWKFRRTGDWGYLPHCIAYDNAGNTPMSPSKK